jgi:hypothetical protein
LSRNWPKENWAADDEAEATEQLKITDRQNLHIKIVDKKMLPLLFSLT